MSAKNRKGPSDTHDAYQTPKWAVRQCLEHIVLKYCITTPRTILEPSAGRGNVVDGARLFYPEAKIFAIDKYVSGEWENADFSTTMDFLDADDGNVKREFDLVIGNPPYSLAQEFIELSCSMGHVVIFLLRIAFMASGKRAEFWERHPPSGVWVHPNRPSFSNRGTDSADYAWFVWQPTEPIDHRKPMIYWLPTMTKQQRGLR